ncbi:MAG: CCA tRNA nucleotidyltransferase [Acidobacteriaceae bacterium]|nr:CCA tRNA nucleotidyltransferase [Acidobacteriaceae bacterium]
MADYIYLLENRLSPSQRGALQHVQDVVRAKGLTLFLTGGAVRDLTSGSPVRDLDLSVQGNALKLKKDLEKAGGVLEGEHEPSQTLYFLFPGSVRLEISSTRSETFPKPGKPVYHPANILEDLRRRDFTVNAMAISLNAGSYGLLMDPLNGVADIEARQLQLVSNYGFIEDPARMIRAVRLSARLGWQMEDKTAARYKTGKEEGYISALSSFSKGYELEEIVHEEDPLRVLKALDHEGWMKELFPAWTPAKASTSGLDDLHEKQGSLDMQGIHPDPSTAHFLLLTAKMTPKDVVTLKKTFARQGFVDEIKHLEAQTRDFTKKFTGKEAATPSLAWKLLHASNPEAVLWLAHSGKGAAIRNKFDNFFKVWPDAKNKVPHALMQEMRIVPSLPIYTELVDRMIFELMDNKLQTPEEQKAWLEPHSPPPPPAPVHIRRPRMAKKADKPKRAKKEKAVAPVAEEAAEAVAAVPVAKAAKTTKVVPVKAEKAAPVKAAKAVPVKAVAKKAVPAKKAAPAKKVVPVKKVVAKKAAPKPVAKKKPTAKPVAKKPAAKKPAPKKVAAKKPAKKKR